MTCQIFGEFALAIGIDEVPSLPLISVDIESFDLFILMM